MKKIILILIILTLCACTTKEEVIKNPNGKSKTYKYLIEEKYNPNQYTIELTANNKKITIIKQNNKIYYKVKSSEETIITIEKNSQKYTLNPKSKTYTKEPISKIDDFLQGYFPTQLKEIKNQTYKTNKEITFLKIYTLEVYTYKENITTYYYQNNKLKKIKTKTPLNETTVNFQSISSKVNKNKFKIPKTYEQIDY